MRKNATYLLMGILLLLGSRARGQMDDFAWGDFSRAANTAQHRITGSRFDLDLLTSPNYFYHDAWMKGTIKTVYGDLIEGYDLRYDAFHDELVAFNNRVNGMFVVDRQQVAGFTLEFPGAGSGEFRKLSPRGTSGRENYYEVIHEGNALLLCRIRIIERKTELYKNKIGQLDDRRYDVQKQYYLQARGLDLKVLEPGRKAIMELFPERKKELRQFFRKYAIHDFSRESNAVLIGLLDQAGYF